MSGVKPRDQCKKTYRSRSWELFVDQEEAQSGGSREVGQESSDEMLNARVGLLVAVSEGDVQRWSPGTQLIVVCLEAPALRIRVNFFFFFF